WSLEQPNLYTLRTIIKQDGKIIDQNEQQIGLRALTFDANKGFALNGVWTKVKGVCIHHDAGCLGAAVPREVWKRRLINLKAMGCNAIRLSHNPQAPEVYELCDEIGLLVMDEAFDEWEFPKRKWITGWNNGTPEFQGSAAFFEEWSDKDLADMVLRDRNHASVVMWSVGNEVDYPNDPYSHPVLDHANINQPMHGGYKPDSPKAERLGGIAKRLTAIVRSLDTSRPVTAALAGVVMSNETDYPFALDITGYNYTEDRYAQDHVKYPNRVIFGSENGHSMASWKAVRDNEYVFGQFLWTGIDYLGESGTWPSRGFYSGLFNFGGFLKPRGHFREALWSSKPVTYIGTYPAPADKNHVSMDAWPVWNYK
ncbi:MAG TPA: glycoside hydrolase family 2 TIM barrel-domain containing protein, partial [Bacteroidales bacterium]|nr:glycoside hydrolase family 2 TIM barrel-domain containing protein [Bacteroidales bacterium]